MFDQHIGVLPRGGGRPFTPSLLLYQVSETARFEGRRLARFELLVTDWGRNLYAKGYYPKNRLFCREFARFDLLALNRFKQRLKIAFPKPVITLALNELKKDRPDHGF